jgi:hypothetical protein
MSTLAPIADKLSKLVRMLTSDRDGGGAAARSINRTLNAGLDIHVLPPPSSAERSQRTPNAPAWHSGSRVCSASRATPLEKERAFVADMVVRPDSGEPTERQAQWSPDLLAGALMT